jgi:hypothetical protein
VTRVKQQQRERHAEDDPRDDGEAADRAHRRLDRRGGAARTLRDLARARLRAREALLRGGGGGRTLRGVGVSPGTARLRDTARSASWAGAGPFRRRVNLSPSRTLSGSPGHDDPLRVLERIHGAVVLELVWRERRWHFFIFPEKCTRSYWNEKNEASA